MALETTGREPLHNLASLGTPVISGVLAEACRSTGGVEDGGVVLGEAFAVVDIADVYEMELHRLTGEVRLRQVPPEGTQVAVELAAHHHRAGDEGRRGDLDYPHRSRRWPHGRPHGVGHDPPVSRAPPDHLRCGADRRGPRAAAGRGLPRAPRGALPGCTAGGPAPRPGGLAATARGGSHVQTISRTPSIC
jgi:hypothetical protein